MTSLALELQNISWAPADSIREGSPLVLNDVSIAVATGQWLVVTGPSGGGKTTLLSIAAGLLTPTRGEVTILGQRLGQMSQSEISRLRADSVGLVFQNFHLDDSRNTRDNILLGGYFSSRSWFQLRERAAELAQALGLEELLDKHVSLLSGGQRQRVAVARALLLRPKLILADEPTGSLDRPTAQLVLNLLETEKAQGASLLTVTHDSRLQERADRVAELDGGYLKESVQAP